LIKGFIASTKAIQTGSRFSEEMSRSLLIYLKVPDLFGLEIKA